MTELIISVYEGLFWIGFHHWDKFAVGVWLMILFIMQGAYTSWVVNNTHPKDWDRYLWALDVSREAP